MSSIISGFHKKSCGLYSFDNNKNNELLFFPHHNSYRSYKKHSQNKLNNVNK